MHLSLRNLVALLGLSTACTVDGPDAQSPADLTTFDIVSYLVTVDLGGSGTGTVAAPLAGIDCPGGCTALIADGDQLELTASSDALSLFMGWTVDPGGTACAGTGGCATTITGTTIITATFALYQALEVTRSGTGTGTVTSSPAGIDCGTDCSELYPPGTTVTLTAAPDGDSTFTGWSGGGCSGTGPCTVDVNSATMVTADFQLQQYELTVVEAGTGAGTVTSSPAGIDCGTDCTEAVAHGTTITLTATPTSGSTFTGWSDGGCTGTGTCTVTVTEATTVTATFVLDTYVLSVSKTGTGAGTVTSSPGSINCGSTCSQADLPGSTFTLAATPSTGSTFTGWSGGGCSGTGTCTVTVTAATSVTAAFTLDQYTLSVIKTGSGGGSVVSSPAAISCGGTCNALVAHGTVVTLTATPVVNSIFGGWSGGGCSGTGTCTVTMTAATTVAANFQRPTYTLSVARTGTGAGTVTSSPGSINCGSTCSLAALNGSTYTLTATPSASSTFTGWSGGGCSGTGTCSVTVTANTTVTATFTLKKYTLSVMKTGSGGGSVVSSPAAINCGGTCNALVDHGTVVTLTATPAINSIFGGWSGGGCSGTGTCTVTMTAAITVGANFQQPTYTLSVARTGTGTGTVMSSPGSINCGSTCSQAALSGSTFTLTATPSASSTFTGWSGGGCSGTGTCSVTVSANTTVTATFTLKKYTLSVMKTGSGGGSVVSSPAAINCSPTCSALVDHGTLVTLTATPAVNSIFGGWSGGGCSGTGTCTVTMTAAITVGANFQRPTYTLSVAKTGTGAGTVTSSPGSINCGSTCSLAALNGSTFTLTATPASGSIFAGWSGGGCSGTGLCALAVTANTTVTATFAPALVQPDPGMRAP